MIETVEMPAQELDACYKIMVAGNVRLKSLAEMIGMDQKSFRAKLFKQNFSLADWKLTDDQANTFSQEIPYIKAVHNIEDKMLRQFHRLARNHANYWAKVKSGPVIGKEDYLQEALLALLDAIYTYTQEDTQFITYAWRVIHNRMCAAANKNYSFSPLTNEAIQLLQRFDDMKLGMNRYVTDDEIYEACRFTQDERKVLQDAQVKVYSACQITGKDCSDWSAANADDTDYTSVRHGIDHEKDTVPCNYEIVEAKERAGLTTTERKVLDTYLCPYYGWVTDLSKTLSCSKTNVNLILQKALGKVRKAYSKRDVA